MKKFFFVLTTLIIGFSIVDTGEGNTLKILCYHRVVPSPRYDFDISAASFEKQMIFLKKNYTIITIEAAAKAIKGKRKFPSKTFVITFDDGYKNLLKYAFPVLKKNQIPFSIYIYTNNTGYLEGLNWEELKFLSENGAEIGSHTVMHSRLDKKNLNENDERYKKRVIKEIYESKQIIEEKLGKKVRYFAYPYGRYNDFVVNETKKAGYEAALSIGDDNITVDSDIFTLKRTTIYKKDLLIKFVENINN